MIGRIALCIVTALLIAAHFLRAGSVAAAILCLAAPLLFLVRRRWSLVVLEGLAYAAGATWLWIAWEVVEMRRAFGQPWLRAAAILVCVAAVGVVTGLLLRGRAMRARYPGRPG